MKDQDKVYVALVNVPKEMTTIDSERIFIEIRAEVMGFVGEEPVIITKVNNLSRWDAPLVKWNDFFNTVDELIKQHFSQFKQEANVNGR